MPEIRFSRLRLPDLCRFPDLCPYPIEKPRSILLRLSRPLICGFAFGVNIARVEEGDKSHGPADTQLAARFGVPGGRDSQTVGRGANRRKILALRLPAVVPARDRRRRSEWRGILARAGRRAIWDGSNQHRHDRDHSDGAARWRLAHAAVSRRSVG